MYLLFDRYHLLFLETDFPPPPKSNIGFQRDRITDCKSGLCFEVSSNYQLELVYLF